MVPRPLQKLGDNSPLVSTMAISLGIVSLILVSYVLNEREREGKDLIGLMAAWAGRHGTTMW